MGGRTIPSVIRVIQPPQPRHWRAESPTSLLCSVTCTCFPPRSLMYCHTVQIRVSATFWGIAQESNDTWGTSYRPPAPLLY